MQTQPNPYAPPEAPVADPDDAPTGPCPHVELACRLIWISFVISLLVDVVHVVRAPSGIARVSAIVGTLMGAAVGLGLLFWVTIKLRAGRNWMRWVYTTFNVLSWLSIPLFWSFFGRYFQALKGDWFAIVSVLGQSIVGIVSVVLLHTSASRAWFRSHTTTS